MSPSRLLREIMLKSWEFNYHNQLARAYISQGRYEEAIEKIEEAIAMVPP